MARKQRLLISIDEALKLYVKRRLSINAIAKQKGVHPDLLRRDLIYLGVAVRSEKQKPDVFSYAPEKNRMLEAMALGLWLGEGTEQGKRVEITNCDPRIIRTRLYFLLEICGIELTKLRLNVQIHDLEQREKVAAYWRDQLGVELQTTCRQRAKTKSQIQKHPMGTARLSFNSVPLLNSAASGGTDDASISVRDHRRVWRHIAARQTLRGARPNREASARTARPKRARSRYDLRVGRLSERSNPPPR